MLSPYHEHHLSDLSVLLYSFHHVSNHHVLTIPGTSCKKSSCWNPIMLVIIILTSVQCTSCKWSLCLNQLVFFLTIYSLCHSSSCIQQCARVLKHSSFLLYSSPCLSRHTNNQHHEIALIYSIHVHHDQNGYS